MKKFAIAAVAALVLSIGAQAAIVTLDIQADQVAKTWKVYAQITDTALPGAGLGYTAGLASYTVKVTSTDLVVPLATAEDMSPKAYPKGFINPLGSYYAVANGVCFDGGQVTTYGGGVNNATKDANVYQGIGIATPVLLAQGTYEGTIGTLNVSLGSGQTGGNVLIAKDAVKGWTGPGNATGASWVSDSVQVPEPATMSLLALGGLALIRRRK